MTFTLMTFYENMKAQCCNASAATLFELLLNLNPGSYYYKEISSRTMTTNMVENESRDHVLSVMECRSVSFQSDLEFFNLGEKKLLILLEPTVMTYCDR